MTGDWFKYVVELSPDSIKEVSLDGIIRFVNAHGIQRVAAENDREIVGRQWTSQWPEDVHHLVERALEEGRQGRAFHFEADCIDFRGIRHYWKVSTTPLRDELGNVTSLLAVNRDVTEVKLAKIALSTLKEALQDRLSDVPAETALAFSDQLSRSTDAALIKLSRGFSEAKVREEQLDVAVAAQRLAEVAAEQAQKGEAVGQLLTGMVHDLNNVLQAATGAIELIQLRSELTPSDQLLLSSAQDAIGHGGIMVKRLLGFARQHPYAPEKINLCELVTQMLPLLQQACSSTVVVECRRGGATSSALVDPNTIERALLNLVINARDASPKDGEISLVVEKVRSVENDIDSQRRPGDYATISVIDCGEGIAPEVRDRLFEAYFTTKPAGKGTGLGLAQVYGAVRQANGSIAVESELGRGTTFTMAFPAL